MAPVYALVISFGLVFILGAVLNDPTTRIQFVIAGQSGSSEPATELAGRRVTVVTDDKDRRQLAQGTLNQSGEFTLTPDQDIKICTTLPAGWSSEDPAVPGASGVSCWGPVARGEDIEITLGED